MIINSRFPVVTADPEFDGADVNEDNPIIGWENLLTIDNVSASSAASGFPATNLANPDTSSYWKGDGVGEHTITGSLSVDDEGQECDYLGIASHNLGSGRIPTSFEAFIDDEWTEIVPQFLPKDDRAILLRYNKTALGSVRLRLREGDEAPQIAVLHIGPLLVMQRRIYVGHAPITMSKNTDMFTAVSENGHYLGRIVRSEVLEGAAAWNNLTPRWVRRKLEPFVESLPEQTFFFGWRPQSYPDEVAYCWVNGNPKPVNARSNGMMSFSMSMQALAL